MRQANLAGLLATAAQFTLINSAPSSKTTFDFDVQTQLYPETQLSLKSLTQGKVAIFVNVASEWGLATDNYAQLNQLLNKYTDLVVIAQPCNQFSGQEPLSGKALYDHIYEKWSPVDRFYFLKKADVNGDDATAIYEFLKNHKNNTSAFSPNFIMWNYEKFLVGKDGVPVERWRSYSQPLEMEGEIRRALGL